MALCNHAGLTQKLDVSCELCQNSTFWVEAYTLPVLVDDLHLIS